VKADPPVADHRSPPATLIHSPVPSSARFPITEKDLVNNTVILEVTVKSAAGSGATVKL
jgi:hypothetical protein